MPELRAIYGTLRQYLAINHTYNRTEFQATLDPLLAAEVERLSLSSRNELARLKHELTRPDLSPEQRTTLQKAFIEAEKKLDSTYLGDELNQCIFFLKKEHLGKQIQHNRFVIRDAENEADQAEVARLLRAQTVLQRNLETLFKNYKRFRGTHV